MEDASPGDLGSDAIDVAGRSFLDRWEHGTRKDVEAREGGG